RLVLAPGYVYPPFRVLGLRDDLVGQPELDERFIIKASDLELARAWLGDTAPGLLGLYDPNTWSLYRVAVRHGEVLVRRDAGKVSAELVVAAVETTVA